MTLSLFKLMKVFVIIFWKIVFSYLKRHLEFIFFLIWYKVGSKLHFYPCAYPIKTKTNYWKDHFLPLICSIGLFTNRLAIYLYVYFRTIHGVALVFLCLLYYYSAVLIAVVSLIVLDIWTVSSQTLIFSKPIWALLAPWHFHINVRICSFHEKQHYQHHAGIILNLYIHTDRHGRFIILSDQIYEHGIFPSWIQIFFYLNSINGFFSEVLEHASLDLLVRILEKYFIEMMVKNPFMTSWT